MIRAFVPNDDPDIDFVWEWFEYQAALLDDSRDEVLERVMSGGSAPRRHEARFVGLTRDEVEEYFDALRDQLELLTMFELLGTTEAIMRIDFRGRVAAEKEDGLSKRYRDLDKIRGKKIRLKEDLLGAMKSEVLEPKAISAFRGALNLRDWIAHGRQWQPRLGRRYTPNDVFDICRDLIDSIPLS